MTSPNVPRNAYTHAPEQHSNLIIGSLQLLWWMIFHPSAFRNHVTRIKFDPERSLGILSRNRQTLNSPLWEQRLQVYLILPLLVGLLLWLVLWGFGVSLEKASDYIVIVVASSIGSGLCEVFGETGMMALAWVLFFVFMGIWSFYNSEVFHLIMLIISSLAVSVIYGGIGGIRVKLLLTVLTVPLFVALSIESVKAFCLLFTIDLWLPVLLYPFLTVWNTLLYQLDTKDIRNQMIFLPWNSAFWYEWQPLPLYGLDKHVLLIMKRNPQEGKAALNYLSISFQQWAAQAVQIELDAEDLESCADISSIRKAHHIFAVTELHSPVGAILNSFSRLSQDIDGALNQGSSYNQRLALTNCTFAHF